MNQKIFRYIIVAAITVFITVPITTVIAEQSGTSPESGTVSKIQELYDKLVLENKGSDEAGSWGDWGSMWNRIYSAAGNSVNYELQILNEYDNYEGLTVGSVDPTSPEDDYEGDEATWTNTLPLTGGQEVWKDERTGLYWSHMLGSFQNKFPDQPNHANCNFFAKPDTDGDGTVEDSEVIEARKNYDGTDIDCGQTTGVDDAINQCARLSLDANNDGTAETNWYLPTQNELMQAYMDGMYNQAGAGTGQTKLANAAAFTTADLFWSSSEVSSHPTFAVRVTLHRGASSYNFKTIASAVRCVARD